MIITTTSTLESRPIRDYLGLVGGEVIVGANVFKDIFASVSDFFGGRSGAYESSIQEARAQAMHEMEGSARRLGADAIVAVDFDYEVIGKNGSMLMVCVCGTAVKLG
ncbi:YbjQ family protein [Sphingomonas astaxanthinifaciens]|uniref:UPF0145 protein GCM10007925_19610 n=1 Tax=Sphingomonas astaxanthinifaciens DSM 22298 TaxID=1123267 RepID=A0ABQ5Z6C7_9SPHN|nr:YbjQ family protein [Sphingomonas astaxanthinifaciens]GLR48248.1 hypothetical protein GCM10007925_19610 [Sphingomonas astaxanthinifaciens DSM 22298]